MSESDAGWDSTLQRGLASQVDLLYGDVESTTGLEQSFNGASQGIQGILNPRLESDCRKILSDSNSQQLLRHFVGSWQKLTEVEEWMKESCPEFREELKREVENLYKALVLDRVEEKVREATVEVIRKKMTSEVAPLSAVMPSEITLVSRVFYGTYQKNIHTFQQKWLMPMIFEVSRMFFKPPLQQEVPYALIGLEHLNRAIDDACKEVESLCPKRKIAVQAKAMMTGLARVQAFKALKGLLEDEGSTLSSLLKEGTFRMIEDATTLFKVITNLRFAEYLVYNHHMIPLSRKLHETIDDCEPGSVRMEFFHGLENSISSAETRIKCYGVKGDHTRKPTPKENLEHAKGMTEVRVTVFVEFIAEKATTLLKNILQDNGSAIVGDLQSEPSLPRSQEWYGPYGYCIHMVHLKDLLGLLVNFDLERKIDEVSQEALRRANTLRAAREDCDHPAFSQEDFFETYLPLEMLTIFEDQKEAIVEFIHKHVLLSNDGSVESRCNICGPDADDVRDGVGKMHYVAYNEQLMRVLRHIRDVSLKPLLDSALSHDAATKDYPRALRLMFARFQETGLRIVCASLFALQVDKRTELLWDLLNGTNENILLNTGLITRVSSEFRQATGFIKSYRRFKLYQDLTNEESSWDHRIPSGPKGPAMFKVELERVQKKFYMLLMKAVHRVLQDDELKVSQVLKYNHKPSVNRIYQCAFHLDRCTQPGYSIVNVVHNHQINMQTSKLLQVMDSLAGQWLDGDNLATIDSEVSKLRYELVELQGNPNVADIYGIKEQQRKVLGRRFNDKVQEELPRIKRHVKTILMSQDNQKVDYMYYTFAKLKILKQTMCHVLVELDVKKNFELHWSTLRRETRQRIANGISLQELVGCSEFNDFVVASLGLHSRLARFKSVFKMSTSFKQLLKYCLRAPRETMAVLLVHHADLVLTGGLQFVSPEELRTRLEQIAKLISFSVEDLSSLVTECLRKRLLKKADFFDRTSTCNRAEVRDEVEFIDILRECCGDVFVADMSQILTDFSNGYRTASKFKDILSAKQFFQSAPIVRSTMIPLPGRAWNEVGEEQFELPAPLSDRLSEFEDFFNDEYPRRRLLHAHSRGLVRMDTTLYTDDPKKTVTIVGSVHQTSILLLVDSRDDFKYCEILDALQFNGRGQNDENLNSKAMIYAALQSLLSPEFPLLKKEPASARIQSQDVININESFVTKEITLHLPSSSRFFFELGLQYVHRGAGNDSEVTSRFHPLKNFVKASVVKLMKEKRRESFQTLFQDVVAYGKDKSASFDTSTKMFKEVVELLIDSEYLERDAEDNSVLVYMP